MHKLPPAPLRCTCSPPVPIRCPCSPPVPVRCTCSLLRPSDAPALPLCPSDAPALSCARQMPLLSPCAPQMHLLSPCARQMHLLSPAPVRCPCSPPVPVRCPHLTGSEPHHHFTPQWKRPNLPSMNAPFPRWQKSLPAIKFPPFHLSGPPPEQYRTSLVAINKGDNVNLSHTREKGVKSCQDLII